jgi:energy-coupling factor transport system permease protein
MLNYAYKDKKSPIHSLGTLPKLAWILSVLVFALLFHHPLYVFGLFVATVAVVVAAGVWREWLGFMKFAAILFVLAIVFNMLLNYNGSHILWSLPIHIPGLGQVKFTLESLLSGVIIGLMLATIISVFSLFTLTVHPDKLMDLMTRLKLPYRSVLLTSLTARFVPTIFSDLTTIADAQRSRGVEMEKGGFINKNRAYATMAVPLLANSLDRAVQVAEAMEARAFGLSTKRTLYKPQGFTRFDALGLAIVLSACALAGVICWKAGWVSYLFNQSYLLAQLGIETYPTLMFLGVFGLLLLIIPLGIWQRRWQLD